MIELDKVDWIGRWRRYTAFGGQVNPYKRYLEQNEGVNDAELGINWELGNYIKLEYTEYHVNTAFKNRKEFELDTLKICKGATQKNGALAVTGMPAGLKRVHLYCTENMTRFELGEGVYTLMPSMATAMLHGEDEVCVRVKGQCAFSNPGTAYVSLEIDLRPAGTRVIYADDMLVTKLSFIGLDNKAVVYPSKLLGGAPHIIVVKNHKFMIIPCGMLHHSMDILLDIDKLKKAYSDCQLACMQRLRDTLDGKLDDRFEGVWEWI